MTADPPAPVTGVASDQRESQPVRLRAFASARSLSRAAMRSARSARCSSVKGIRGAPRAGRKGHEQSTWLSSSRSSSPSFLYAEHT
jgi:hypothetical protein